MRYKKFGKTNFKVSELGFGGIPIMSGRETEFLVKLKDIKEGEAIKTIRLAYEEGINFFDTAVDYRDSEEKIGKALKDVRKKVIIASKSKALTYQKMKADVMKSLKKLDTSYIDLYQLHYVKDKESYNKIMDTKSGAYKALLELKKKGIIKEIGIASHNHFVLKPAILSKKFATVQLPLNLIEQDCIKTIKLAKKHKLGIIIMKPYAGGSLVKSLPKTKNLSITNKKMKSLALQYILLLPEVDTVIPGMANRKELKENIKIVKEKKEITDKDKKLIKEIRKRLGQVFCRRCQYCEPFCPKGIKISVILRLIKYFEDYNLKGWAKEQYNKLETKGNECIECYFCEPKCPYDINIVSELKRIHKLLKKK